MFLFLKGLAMGGADVVPGVSGGTIALIAGIYEELIETINKVNLSSLKLILKGRLKEFWKEINGNFLLVLIAGIAVSFLSLAKLMTILLEEHPLLLWSFFFGLIIASAWLIGKELNPFKWSYFLAIVIGTGISYYITTIAPTNSSDNLIYLFFCGTLAFCAMILPGISGSFILLLLGAYSTVIGAVANISSAFKESISIIIAVGLGGIVGLLSFSKLLNWLFKKYRHFTIAVMTGFLIGSLNKIWPWQHITEVYIKHKGEEDEEIITMAWDNVLPQNFDIPLRESIDNLGNVHTHITADPQLIPAIGLCLAGFLTIFLLERIGRKR